MNENDKQAIIEAIERRTEDHEFRIDLRRIVNEDQELLRRLSK